jgi:predicted RNase H-like HicB family nuclease
MEKIHVKIGWSGDNYSCVAEHSALNGVILVTGKTLDEIKEDFQESLQFHIEGCIQDGDKLPEWLTGGNYELCYTVEVSALIHRLDGILTRSSIARVSGIKKRQIELYASGYRVPRPQQKEKIINAIHSIGRELVSFNE